MGISIKISSNFAKGNQSLYWYFINAGRVVPEHEFKHKNLYKLCKTFSLCLYENQQIWIHCMQLQQWHGACSLSHLNGYAFTKTMFAACVQVAQRMFDAPVCTGLYTFCSHLCMADAANFTFVRHTPESNFHVYVAVECCLNQFLWNFTHTVV